MSSVPVVRGTKTIYNAGTPAKDSVGEATAAEAAETEGKAEGKAEAKTPIRPISLPKPSAPPPAPKSE